MPDTTILISQLKGKDEKALGELYDAYSGAIYSLLLKMLKDEVKAQELLQDTFIAVWDKADSYNESKGRFYTWVYRIAKNKALNELRKPKKLIQTDDFSVYNGTEMPKIFDEEHLKLKGKLTKLKEKHRIAIELVYFKGLTHREAHEEMGVPLGTFKSYIKQALKILRVSLKTVLALILVLIFGG